jgi:hypothetical protein
MPKEELIPLSQVGLQKGLAANCLERAAQDQLACDDFEVRSGQNTRKVHILRHAAHSAHKKRQKTHLHSLSRDRLRIFSRCSWELCEFGRRAGALMNMGFIKIDFHSARSPHSGVWTFSAKSKQLHKEVRTESFLSRRRRRSRSSPSISLRSSRSASVTTMRNRIIKWRSVLGNQ